MQEYPLVSIQCLVYNHEPYLRQCLDGFVMQKTNFKFEAIVHDDKSTDGSAKIIAEYAEKYPEIIRPIYETENQYSKRDGSLERIVNQACRGKYIALCEGDDYWTDQLKLQKQVDLMLANPEVTLCFHANLQLFPDGKIVTWNRYSTSIVDCDIRDIIIGGGGMMATNSMLYLKEACDSYPKWAMDAPVGDGPLMLVLAVRGKVAYINEIMSVYRISSISSWTVRMQNNHNMRRRHFRAIRKMWNDFDAWSNYKFHESVREKKRINFINYYKSCLKGFLLDLIYHTKCI